MNNSRHPVFRRRHSGAGFSLIEMAIVLLILGTLLSGVLVAVSQTTESTRRTNARAQLRQVEEALYGFAQAYGRLPCPAIPGSGVENQNGGQCNTWHGFVPSTTLGIDGSVNADGLLLDPWQNPLRYSVARDFTTVAGMKSRFASTGTPQADLCISEASDCTSGAMLTNIASALVLSMGANWPTFSSTAEQENATGAVLAGPGGDSYTVNGGNDNFVSTAYAEQNFDDQLVWLSPYLLFTRLISAGKLP